MNGWGLLTLGITVAVLVALAYVLTALAFRAWRQAVAPPPVPASRAQARNRAAAEAYAADHAEVVSVRFRRRPQRGLLSRKDRRNPRDL